MRTGDQARLIAIAGLSLAAYLIVIGGLFMAAGIRLTWALPLCLGLSALTVWASISFFGVVHLERLAAHIAHGGRHYYFGAQEVDVLVDEFRRVWVRLSDVQACVGGEARLLKHYSVDEAGYFEGQGQRLFLSPAGVRRYLQGREHPDLQKFRLWFERELVMPMERRREQGLPVHGTGKG